MDEKKCPSNVGAEVPGCNAPKRFSKGVSNFDLAMSMNDFGVES